jgi:K+-transporting ATPase ATPase C chain
VIKQLRPALAMLAILTLLTGILYPLVVTGIAQLAFPRQTNGSLVSVGESVVGSALLGQANAGPRYFQPRPSATGYDTLPSGGSNLAPTSLELAAAVAQRAADFRAANGLSADAAVPVEMLFASGSGLDPHISPNAARLQVGRVAAARGLDEATVAALVEEYVEGPQLGILGQPRVNVLVLNLALDGLE